MAQKHPLFSPCLLFPGTVLTVALENQKEQGKRSRNQDFTWCSPSFCFLHAVLPAPKDFAVALIFADTHSALGLTYTQVFSKFGAS